jgi:hypothetical protein
VDLAALPLGSYREEFEIEFQKKRGPKNSFIDSSGLASSIYFTPLALSTFGMENPSGLSIFKGRQPKLSAESVF